MHTWMQTLDVLEDADLGEDIESEDKWDQHLQTLGQYTPVEPVEGRLEEGANLDMGGQEDLPMEENVQSATPGKKQVAPENVIDLNDDDPLNHVHSSNDDEEPNRSLLPYEKKPTIIPDGKMKVEGDW